MKRIFLTVMVLGLGAGLLAGCKQDKKPIDAEKAKAVATEAVESAREKAIEVKEEVKEAAKEAAVAVKEKAVEVGGAVKEAAKGAAETVKEKAAEVKEAVPVKIAPGGDKVYKARCLACHGPDGKGTAMAPAFIGNEWIKGASKADIANVVKNGRQPKDKRHKNFAMGMPAQTGMPEDDVTAVVDYLKSLN